MPSQNERDVTMHTLLEKMARIGIENAAEGLSTMIGQEISMTVPAVTVASISSVAERVGGAEAPVVGVYLGCEGDVNGHIMLILQREDALPLVDLLLGQAEGETTAFDAMARSALAEIGNVTASYFLNATADTLGLCSRPTPPAVIVDMAGAILDIMLVSAGQLSDEVLLLEAVFHRAARHFSLYFWVLPDLIPLQELFVEEGRL